MAHILAQDPIPARAKNTEKIVALVELESHIDPNVAEVAAINTHVQDILSEKQQDVQQLADMIQSDYD